MMPNYCAYNQTRECFLSLEVKVADGVFGLRSLHDGDWALKSSEGLWITSLRSAPAEGFPQLLDLILLDARGVVLKTIDTAPSSHPMWGGMAVASILVLPYNSVFSTQTRSGDQLVICPADEMQRRLEQIANPPIEPAPQSFPEPAEIASAVLVREKPLWSGGPGVLTLNDRYGVTPAPAAAPATHEMPLTVPGSSYRAPRTWLERFWTPDPRRAPRVHIPALAAYYWNGAAPEARQIRDISFSGLYVVTEERWYPGTLILITLQRSGDSETLGERSLSVQSRAVRWGSDGVGLQFVLNEEKRKIPTNGLLRESANRIQLEKFLTSFRTKR